MLVLHRANHEFARAQHRRGLIAVRRMRLVTLERVALSRRRVHKMRSAAETVRVSCDAKQEAGVVGNVIVCGAAYTSVGGHILRRILAESALLVVMVIDVVGVGHVVAP